MLEYRDKVQVVTINHVFCYMLKKLNEKQSIIRNIKIDANKRKKIGKMVWKAIHKRWMNFLIISSGIVTKFIMTAECFWFFYQEEIPKDAVKLKK